MDDKQLFVFGGQDESILSVLHNINQDALGYFDAIVKEELNKDYTFTFKITSDHVDAIHLKEFNLVGFYDDDNDFQLFKIYRVEEEHTANSIFKQIHCEHAIYEIVNDIVEDKRVLNGTATEALAKGLSSSRWQVGNVATFKNANCSFYFQNGLASLKEIQKIYGGEYKYRVEIDGNKIKARYVDLLTTRGTDNGKRFEYTKDIQSIKRTVDMSTVKTALYGRGKSSQTDAGGYTRKLDFGSVVWTKPINPADKILNQKWIGDEDARSMFGGGAGQQHITGIAEFDTEDPKELLQLTWDELQRIKVPSTTYEMDVQVLEMLDGYDHEKVRLGDTVSVLDYAFNPPLLVRSRVIAIEYNLGDNTKKSIVLGNFIPLITDVIQRIEELSVQFKDMSANIDTKPIDDSMIRGVIPATPQNVEAQGLFRNISLKWTFSPTILISGYEVYGSKTAGFTPSPTTYLGFSNSGGYLHKAETNETWHFRIRAVNPKNEASPYTDQISASTNRIQTVDYEDLSITNAKIGDISADKLTAGTIDANKIDVRNINADNITAGTIKSNLIQIGSTTRFESPSYDPFLANQRAIEAQKAAEQAKLQADTAQADLNSVKKNIVYKVELLASNGTILRNGFGTTKVRAVVYLGATDVTGEINASRFKWSRVSDDKPSDTIWNQKYPSGPKEITITGADVKVKSMFQCEIMDV